ncbi:hypothetical protein EJ08DRAFT_97865 [Tothia fuscella]|uniref:DUF6594 domain-containing protein n=1 Tax=Tothia fuscella TaxID=1048955 RepID=A0A9P4NE75_9PEZI|nr:hypothetical protein EJ08DRAFT_97865 [Tothia fuscella]
MIDRVSVKLHKYNNLLHAHFELRSRGQAPNHIAENVKDLLSISLMQKGALEHFFEEHPIFPMRWLWHKKALNTSVDSTPGEEEVRQYSSDERIVLYSTISIFLIGLFMLIAPLWILNIVHPQHWKLGVITIFVVVFLAVLSFVTEAKPFENLAATVAYCAVLVVFLQSGI